MKRSLVILALAVLPMAIAPPPPGMSPALPTASQSRGITVTASAIGEVPASSARIVLSLNSYDNKAELDAAALAPLVDALVKAGADRRSIQVPLAFGAGARSNTATVSATIAAPSVDTMRSGITTVGAAVASLHDIRLTSAQIFLKTNDCSGALAKTRARALAQARAKAESLARDLHVRVGAVLGVQTYDSSTGNGSCFTQYWVGPEGPQFPPTMDGSDTDYVSIPVTAGVTVTYAIK